MLFDVVNFSTELFEDAVAYASKRRDVEPAIYNIRRLFELLQPDNDPDEHPTAVQTENAGVENAQSNGNVDEDAQSNETVDEDAQSNDNVDENMQSDAHEHVQRNEVATRIVTSAPSTSTAGASSTVTTTTSGVEANTPIDSHEGNENSNDALKVEYVPLFEPRSSNMRDVGIILLEPEYEVQIVDEMEIKFVKGQEIKPMKSTTEGLIKREHDIVSGDVAFNQSVSIFY